MVIFTERNDADRFRHALDKIEDGHREIRELAEKMRSQYGERGTRGDRDGDGRYNERGGDYGERGGYGERGYGERGGYGERDGYGRRDGGYGERRDSMGRYRD